MRKYLLMILLVVMLVLTACEETGTTDTRPTEAPLGPALTETVDDAVPTTEPTPTRES